MKRTHGHLDEARMSLYRDSLAYLCSGALEFLQASLQALHVADEFSVLLSEEVLVKVDLGETTQ